MVRNAMRFDFVVGNRVVDRLEGSVIGLAVDACWPGGLMPMKPYAVTNSFIS